MTLPTKPLPTGTVPINGTDVPIRALSFTETKRLVAIEDESDAADVLVLTAGTGVTDEEARDWFAKTDAPVVNAILKGILVLSGLRSADPQPGSTGDEAA